METRVRTDVMDRLLESNAAESTMEVGYPHTYTVTDVCKLVNACTHI